MKLIVQTMTVADAVKAMREAGMKSSPDRVMAGIKQWMKERGETVEPDEGAAGSKGVV